jgi:succinate dehydrogenase hydrophobic anchor subunit
MTEGESKTKNPIPFALGEIVTLYTGAMYGLTWVFYSSFYDVLGVQTEEIGISVEYFLVRITAATFGLIPLGIIYYLLSETKVFSFLKNPEDQIQRVFRSVFSAFVLVSISLSGVQIYGSKPWRSGWWSSDVGKSILVYVIIFGSSGLLVWLSGYHKPKPLRLAFTILLLAIVVLVAAVYLTGRQQARTVLLGSEIQSPIVRVTRVMVIPRGDFGSDHAVSLLKERTCMMYLGNSGPVLVLLTTEINGPRRFPSHPIVYLPIDQFELRSSSPEECRPKQNPN